MKFERGPIKPEPTCAICGKKVKDHLPAEMIICSEERRKAHESVKDDVKKHDKV